MYAEEFFSERSITVVFLTEQGAGMVDHGNRLQGLDANVNLRLDNSPEFDNHAKAIHFNGYRITSCLWRPIQRSHRRSNKNECLGRWRALTPITIVCDLSMFCMYLNARYH